MKFAKLFLLFIAVFLFLVIFFPKKSTQQNSSVQPTTTKQQLRKIDLTIADRKLTNKESTFSVNQDDLVEISINSDQDGEFHLHGYDKEVELKNGKEALIGFTASISGRFTMELHGNPDTELGALEVLPK